MSGLTARTAEKERRGTKLVVHGRDESACGPDESGLHKFSFIAGQPLLNGDMLKLLFE